MVHVFRWIFYYQIYTGTFGVDCLDRYFRLGFDTTFTGEDVRFEAVGKSQHAPLLNYSSLS